MFYWCFIILVFLLCFVRCWVLGVLICDLLFEWFVGWLLLVLSFVLCLFVLDCFNLCLGGCLLWVCLRVGLV